VGRFGIAAKKESMSVLFFSEQKFSEINRDSTVYLTNESESSVRLLYLLFGYYQGFDSIPCQTNNKEKANGELIIGDAALLKARSWKDKACYDVQNKTKYNHVTDLAVEWYSAFKLPFVFARWVIRKDAPGKVRSSLENWLAEFQEREQELIATSIPKTAKRLGLSNNQMMRYFSILRRTLDNEDINGQKLFLQEIQKYVQNAIFSV
jgi:predicted solute-binding protein